MTLFDPFELEGLTLPNRIVMAPMTRSRVALDGVLTALNAKYYAQRATSGLIVSEAMVVDPGGRGYLFTPGIYSREQMIGARLVADAVHLAGGRIFAQLWHVGRIGHSSVLPPGEVPVGPTSEPLPGVSTYGYDENGRPGVVPLTPPRALSDNEVEAIARNFALAARNAIEAGFDGVEILAGNGYLFDQFQNGVVNTRAGRFGGASAEDRLRFLALTIELIRKLSGAPRIGVRISPFGVFNGMADDPQTRETYLALASALECMSVVYVHFNDEPVSIGHLNQEIVTNGGSEPTTSNRLVPPGFVMEFRERYSGPVIICGGLDRVLASTMLTGGQADLCAFGIPFIANPDLPERFSKHWPLAEPDIERFYGGGAEGYTDYPTHRLSPVTR